MNNKFSRDEDMIHSIKTMSGNLICTTCEQTALRVTQESAAIQTQNEKLKTKMRAQEQDSEKRLLQAEQRFAQLTEQCNRAQATPMDNDTVLQQFGALKNDHLITQRQMNDKYQALIEQSEVYK